MKASELVGKLAIRTERTKRGDGSFTDEALNILKVTEHHILYNHVGTREEFMFGDEIMILGCDWIDGNWADYNELIKGYKKSKVVKKLKKKKRK